MRVCEHCGKELNAGAKFCINCGASTASAEAPKVDTPEAVEAEVAQADTAPSAQDNATSGSYTPPDRQATVQQGSYQQPTAQQGSYQQTAPQQGSYQQTAPQQGGYQQTAPQQGGYQQVPVQPTAVRQKKPIDKRLFLFGGIGIAVIAVIIILASLIGGRKDKADSSNPYVGVWHATSVEIWGETTPAEEVFGNLDVAFKANGKCDFQTDEGTNSYKWEETEREILITSGKDTIITCIKEGDSLVVEDFMNTGMKIIFEKEGTEQNRKQDAGHSGKTAEGKQGFNKPSLNTETVDSDSMVQEKWNGSWYGFLYLSDAYGDWKEYDEDIYDAYMVIDVDEDGNGTMAIFIGDDEGQTVDSYIFADENHFEVTEGEFWDCGLTLSQWWLAISPVDEGHLVVISDTYIDSELTEDDGFDYMFMFRPWGELWEQEEKEVANGEPGSKLPPGYNDYAAAIANGVADPNAFEGGLGGNGSQSGAGSTGNADLPEGSFSTETVTFTYDGITMLYPKEATAGSGFFGGAEVALPNDSWITAVIEPQYVTPEELYKSLEGYLPYKNAQLYKSTYNGYDCIVLIHDTDKSYTAEASISVYVLIENNKQVHIEGTKIGGVLERMMEDQDLLAVIQNVTW